MSKAGGSKLNVFQTVMKFLKDTNRPYSLNDVWEKGAKEFTKSAVQNAIDVLVGKNQVLEKIYGKQKVYVIVQDKDATDEEMLQIQLRTLDDDIKRMEADVKNKEARIKTIEQALKTSQSSMTRAEVDAQMATLKTAVDALHTQAATMRDKGAGQLDPAEQKRVQQQFDKYSTVYRKRKRMCTNMIDMIMESYPKTKKQLVADVGIETDEDVGFVPNTI